MATSLQIWFWAILGDLIRSKNMSITLLKIICFLTISLQFQTDNSIYENFKIRKGALGKIQVGQSINEAEIYLENFRIEKHEAWLFGFGGGGEMNLYYHDNEPIIGLIPKLETDIIHAIIVISEKFTDGKGLSTALNYDQLSKLFPETEILLDEMNDWERCIYQEYNWQIIFGTERNARIGNYIYDENFIPSKNEKLSNTNTKIDWITIQ